MTHKDRNAMFRGAPGGGGSARSAYNDLIDWAITDLYPEMKPKIKRKMKELVDQHGTTYKELAMLVYRPPVGETRKDLVGVLYDILFS